VARSIERACRPGQVPSSGFGDLGDVHRTGVECVAWWRVVVGTSPSTFRPTGTITRDQLATFVVNLAAAGGRPLPASPTNHFDDDNGSVHEANVNRVASAGIMGSATRSFSPGLAVSRSSMATVVANTYRHVARVSLPAGPDAFGDDGAVASQGNINSVAAAGIAVGYADGSFRPASPVSREQMATFFARLLDALVVGGHTSAR
jgi:subtilisin